jgi:hypothetical protein
VLHYLPDQVAQAAEDVGVDLIRLISVHDASSQASFQ